jgi:hypothetical protein
MSFIVMDDEVREKHLIQLWSVRSYFFSYLLSFRGVTTLWHPPCLPLLEKVSHFDENGGDQIYGDTLLYH